MKFEAFDIWGIKLDLYKKIYSVCFSPSPQQHTYGTTYKSCSAIRDVHHIGEIIAHFLMNDGLKSTKFLFVKLHSIIVTMIILLPFTSLPSRILLVIQLHNNVLTKKMYHIHRLLFVAFFFHQDNFAGSKCIIITCLFGETFLMAKVYSFSSPDGIKFWTSAQCDSVYAWGHFHQKALKPDGTDFV